MNKKYKAFSINFASKAFLSKNKNESQIKGKAYYVLNDEYKIIKQFIQLEYCTFRPTDNQMLKTHYYKNHQQTNRIRIEYLENIQKKLLNKEFNEIDNKEKIRLKIPDDDLIIINKQLLKMNKIKRSIDVFTGSNSSGAKTNPLATNILSYENNEILRNGINFSNPLNSSDLYQHQKIEIHSLDDIELIPISEYLRKVNLANELLLKYNFIVYHMYNDIDFDGKKNIDAFINELKNEIKPNIKLNIHQQKYDIFVDQIKNYINTFNFESIRNDKDELNKIARKLREFQKNLIRIEKDDLYEIHQLKNNTYFNDFIIDSNDPNCQHCHIIPVSSSIKNINTWFEIADNNNCLLLSPSLHKCLDNKQIIFNQNGECISLNGEQPKNSIFLKKEILTKKRIKYLNTYYKNMMNQKN